MRLSLRSLLHVFTPAVYLFFGGVISSGQTPAELERYAEHLSEGTLLEGAERESVYFTGNCPVLQPRDCYYSHERIEHTCRPDDLIEIGSIDGRKFLMVRYERTVYLQSNRGCGTHEVLVLEATRDGRVKPVWFDATNPHTSFIGDVSVVSAKTHSFLVVRYCVRGTMGCWDSAYLWNGRWEPLGNDATWEEVYRNLPPGYQVHKSAPIDFRNLKWEQSIATTEDANCCPSGKILFDLDIVNGELSVKSYRFMVRGKDYTVPRQR